MRSLSMHYDRIRASGLDLSLSAIGAAILKMVVAWQDRSRERSQLAMLDDYLLRDMGITRTEVAREISKAFWQR